MNLREKPVLFQTSVLIAAVAITGLLLQGSVVADEWPAWRGTGQRGFSPEKNLPAKWSKDGENLLWTMPVGARSAPVAWDGRIYVLHLTGEGETWQEEVVCMDAESGKVLWRYAFNIFLTDIPSTRVGWSNPCVDPETGNVIVHGVQGVFVCIDKDGKMVWHHSLTEEFGRISGYGGRTHTPMVDEGRVIISFLNSSWGKQGRGSHRYLALDKLTGEVVWWSTPGGAPLDTTYSMPSVAVVDGVRTLVVGCADGNVYGLKSATGEKIWTFRLSKRGLNASVIVHGGLAYACHSEENQLSTDPKQPVMGRVVCFKASGSGDITETNEVWRVDGLTAGYSSPAADDKYLYVGANSANIHCFDLKTGREAWVHNVGTVLKASPVVGDGKLYVGEVSGHFSILKLGDKKAVTLSKEKFALKDGRPMEINGSACIARGKVYFCTSQNIYCIGKASAGTGAAGIPWPASSAKAEAGAKPSHIQVLPAEVETQPGKTIAFKALLFDSKGRLIGECAPQWSVSGLSGEVDARGTLSTARDGSFQGGLLTASHAGLKGSARVRVVPSLPLKIDFEDRKPGLAPSGWISAGAVKFKIVDLDGNKALKKLSDKPKFILARMYFGLHSQKGYTFQLDMMGTEQKFQLPDMGFFVSRYRFDLLGNRQGARIVSWSPMPRLEKKIKFKWDPKVWYTAKMKVDRSGGKAIVRAKVWKRGTEEPVAWTLEVNDSTPNRSGAPGLYAYSAGSTDKKIGGEIFYDNIIITENK